MDLRLLSCSEHQAYNIQLIQGVLPLGMKLPEEIFTLIANAKIRDDLSTLQDMQSSFRDCVENLFELNPITEAFDLKILEALCLTTMDSESTGKVLKILERIYERFDDETVSGQLSSPCIIH